jgi:hypothetical protein
MLYYSDDEVEPEEGTYEMGEAKETGFGGQGTWTHTDVYDHGSQTGETTYCKSYPSYANMGPRFIVMPNGYCRDQTPRCTRTALGIHGGGPWMPDVDKCMRVDQGLPNTHGCIRMRNGCRLCQDGRGYLYWLGKRHDYWRDTKGHHVFIYVPE